MTEVDSLRENGSIRLEKVEACPLCGGPKEEFYRQVEEYICGVPGKWDYQRCRSCDLLWLTPRPIQEDIAKIYPEVYFDSLDSSHDSPLSRLKRRVNHLICSNGFGYRPSEGSTMERATGRLLGWTPFLRDMSLVSIRCLEGPAHGKLLDVGCGDGVWLAQMRDLGWDVVGLEPSPETAAIARSRFGLRVVPGFLEEGTLEGELFDAITLVHVIEHVPNPVELLARCWKLLATGGRIVLATPNLNAWAHKLFKNHWCSLDPPRHFTLFSGKSLRSAMEKAGFRVDLIRSSSWPARGAWSHSQLFRKGGRGTRVSRWDNFVGTLFLAAEVMGRELVPSAGEELIVCGVKQ